MDVLHRKLSAGWKLRMASFNSTRGDGDSKPRTTSIERFEVDIVPLIREKQGKGICWGSFGGILHTTQQRACDRHERSKKAFKGKACVIFDPPDGFDGLLEG
jgi:hypothetical protein